MDYVLSLRHFQPQPPKLCTRAYRKLQISKSTYHLGVLSFGAQMWAAGENVKLSYLLLKAPTSSPSPP